jgi:hypothetical protein
MLGNAPAETESFVSKIKNPEEKKAKSYNLDRRNVYGESPHAARKSIPRGKARAHRAERHEVRQAVRQVERADLRDADATEKAETAIASAKLQRLGGFKKVPDAPLGVLVARKQMRGVADHGAKKRRAARRS